MQTPFVGRTSELAGLRQMLVHERLITVLGPGGIGKTRVADEILARGAWTRSHTTRRIDLDEVGSGELAAVLLSGLAVPEQPGQDLVEALVAELGGGPMLLLLDGCESRSEELASLIEEILRRCPELIVLATSRRPLEASGERVWVLPPMSTPAGATRSVLTEVLESDAGRLFVANAEMADPDFVLTAAGAAEIGRICRALEGLPLAIGLAAARSTEVDLNAIAADLPAQLSGQDAAGGLWASLEWSYGLLREPEQKLFRRFAALSGALPDDVFALALGEDEPRVAASLERLVSLGLISVEEDLLLAVSRFRMSPALRTYARRLLDEAAESEPVLAANLEHFTRLAKRANELLGDVRGRRILALSGANFRAAFAYAMEKRDPRALEMCGSLVYWWFASDRFSEGREACEQAIARFADADPAARAMALRSGALLAIGTEDYEAGHAMAVEALDTARASGDRRATGLAMQTMNLVLATVDPAAAARSGARAAELLHDSGTDHDLAHALLTQAVAEALRDCFGTFDSLRAELDGLRSVRGDDWLLVMTELHAAWARIVQGRPRAALAEARRAGGRVEGERSTRAALATAHELHARALQGEAGWALGDGLHALAAARAADAEVAALSLEVAVAFAQLALGQFDAVESAARRSLEAPALHAVIFWREVLARIALERGQPAEAAGHAAAIRTVAGHSGSPRAAALADQVDGCCALARGELDEATELLHAALLVQSRAGCDRDAAECLEALGRLAGAAGDDRRAVRLIAAADAGRRELGIVRVPPESAQAVIEKEGLFGALSEHERVDARTAGQGLSLREAIAFARRSRGRRPRAEDGWASLTPAETQAAALAAGGATNPEIADRLLMSKSTVKTHLSRAYRKLGVSNRTELAARYADVGEPG